MSFLRTIEFLSLGVLLADCSGVKEENPRPNIVIIYADDMGYGDLNCQNPGSKIPTPNLDRLAAEGMHFPDAHTSSGICSPSRFALLTGQYHWRRTHGIVESFGPPMFRDGDISLPQVLKKAGYATACIGKWHLGWNWNFIHEPSGERTYGHFSMGEFRGLKRDVWEGGHHIPFIVRWPGKVKAGSVSDELISQVDIMATLAAAIGIPLPENAATDSYNFIPVWTGREYGSPLREATVHNTYKGQWGLRQGKWLYINKSTGEITKMPDCFKELRGYTDFDKEGLLFDMEQDPEQRVNLYSQFPEKIKSMEELLSKYLENSASRK